jgi:AraC-like DNA-binding protein
MKNAKEKTGIGRFSNVKVFVQTPCEALRPFVKRFLVVEFPTAHKDSFLPVTGMLAGFCFKGHCILDGKTKVSVAAVTGLSDRPRHYEHSGNSGVVLAAFTAPGAAALLRHPADEFFNDAVAMDDILGNSTELNRIHERLAEAPNHARRIQVVEDFLVARGGDAQPDTFVSAAVSKIEEVKGMVRVEELARRVGLSQSALERRFRKVTGASPKKFASIVRLRHVVRLRARGADLTSIAFAAGYCDQSHFINDFKQITGLAPKSFFQRTTSAKNAEFLQVGEVWRS